MAGPWEKYAPTAAPVTNAPPAVIYGEPKDAPVPTPKNPIDIQNDVRDHGFKVGEASFDNATKLRNEFTALPQVKEYQTVIRSYDAALKTDSNPTGDQALITAYAKMLDPGSVVREQEFDTIASGDSAVGKIAAKLAKELGVDESGLLRPEVRARVRNEMQNLVEGYNQTYSQAREQYRTFAERAQVDPLMVVGEHYGEPYLADIEKARRAYYEQSGAPGLTAEQEEKAVQFWNQQRGNPRLTANMAKQWYQQQGIPAPSDDDLETAIAQAMTNNGFTGLPDGAGPPEMGPNFNPNTDGLGNLMAQGFTLGLSDELAGAGEFLGAIVNDQNPLSAYRTGRDAERARLGAAREANPYLGVAAEFVPSILVGGPVIKGATALGTAVKSGSALGAVSGFGYGEGALGSTTGAGGGAVLGGALGYGGQKAADWLASRVPARGALNFDRDVVEAGQRQGIPIRQPDARPDVRNRYAELEPTTHGGPIVQAARSDDAAAIEARAVEVTGGQPFARNDATSVGQSAQRIAERGNEQVREKAGSLYTRVEQKAPGFKVPGSQTIAAIDRKIADLSAASPTGYRAEIDALENMKADLASTGLSVDTLQAQRMTVGGRIGDNIADRTRAEATLSEVLKVAQNELHSSLATANPSAAALLKRADAKWAQYKDLQREVTGLFLGKRGDATAETAARQLNTIVNGRGNYKALRRFMTLAAPEERADFAATFAREWGGNARGEFSPAIFAKNVGSASDRTLNAIFGRDGRLALRDLQAISNAKTDAMSRQSPSGVTIAGASNGLKRLLWGVLGFGTGDPSGAIAGGAAQGIFQKIGEQRTARLLLNPNFTKWLRQAPNTQNPRAIDQYFRKLGNITTVAANDNQAFQTAIREVFAQSPSRVAGAEERPEESQKVGGEPPR